MARILRLQTLSVSTQHSLGFLQSNDSDHCSGWSPSAVSNHCCVQAD